MRRPVTGPGRADRAAEDGGDELGEDLVRQGVGIGGALEGEPVQRSGDRRRQRRRREAQLEAELLGHPLEGVGERVADRVAPLGELALQLGIADAERPELVEEQRPVGIGLEEGAELIGGLRAGVALALGRVGDRLDLSDPALDLASAIARKSSSLPSKFE